ncbi:MAG: phage holin family protein [Steroidobacteraceae bacterium]|nr:phage holin family protein [Steroidobacteraceae bacterium]MCC7198280.1 phage holin family protein [Gammaproteobacteria bacterium]
MQNFILRAAFAAVGLWLATLWVDGITVDAPTTLLLAALLLGIVNAIVKPVMLLLTLPFLLLSLGLFLLVVNAAMLGLVSAFLPGMHVAGFWAALWGALLISFVSWLGSAFLGPKGRGDVRIHRG